MEEKNENYFIDFLRFIFSIGILIYHGRVFAPNMDNALFLEGRLGVGFFFIVTGYLMMNTIYKNKETTVFKDYILFMYRKIKSIFPGMLVASIIGAIFVYERLCFTNPLLVISNILVEIFQLGVFGHEYNINCSWWYISVMIFILLFLYPLARKFKDKYVKFIALLILALVLFDVYYNSIDINNPLLMDHSFKLINGLFKGLIFIPLGNIAYLLTDLFKKNKSKINKIIIKLLSILEIMIYVILILNLHFRFLLNPIFAVLLTFNVILTFSGITYTSKVFKSPVWKKLGRYGFYIYLCNTSIRVFMVKKYVIGSLSYSALLLRFTLISLLVALLIYFLIEILYKRLLIKKD